MGEGEPVTVGTRRLGKYEIVARLGHGGMAEVYRAYHASLDRDVAIKVLHASLAGNASLRHRLEREARHIARLRHHNIVQVYDFEADATSGVWYMVMEYIDGPTLRDVLAYAAGTAAEIPLNEALWLIREALAALAYAHGQGVIHRDVKPANLMIDMRGGARVVLADFGIALIASGSGPAYSGGMVGTPAYSAPEQGLGEAGDERADLYSVGVMLFHMLTGRLPFEGETPMEIILKHLNAPPPSILSLRPDAPPALEAIVQRLLAKEPDERYDSAAAVIDDLDQVLGLLPPPDHHWLAQAAQYRAEYAPQDEADAAQPESPTITPKFEELVVQPTARRRLPCLALLLLALVLLGTLVAAAALVLVPGGVLAPETQAVITATQRETTVPSPSATAQDETPVSALAAPASTAHASPAPTATLTITASPSPAPSETATHTPSVTYTLTETHTATATFTEPATATFAPSLTPTAEAPTAGLLAAPPTALPSVTADPCRYDYRIVAQNRANGELVPANAAYEREIQVQNTGLCAWPRNSALVFLSGSSLNATPPYVFLRNGLAVGEVTTILFRGRAPEVNGLHVGAWALFTDAQMAIGAPFEISITVYGGRSP